MCSSDLQTVVNHIKSHDSAAEGSVKTLPHFDGSEFSQDDMIICRNTAPLISLAYSLIGRQIPCKVLGRDIGVGLIKLIDKLKARDISGPNGLITKLGSWAQKETERALAKGQEGKVQAIDDKVESIGAFIGFASSIEDLKNEINKLFSNKSNVVTLSTIHKSKGLEADKVFILDPELMPSKWARKEWQTEQERNLMYVAYTRAKTDLVFINSDKFVSKTIKNEAAA